MEKIYFILFSFIIGLISGSSMTCLGQRMMTGKSWIKGRSACDFCHHVLAFRDLIPVISYLLNHGRCRYCGKKLSQRYLWTEILSGIVFVLVYMKEQNMNFHVLMEWSICSILMALSVTDMDSFLIPDIYIVCLIILWMIQIIYAGFQNQLNGNVVLNDISGALFPSSVILLTSMIMGYLMKKETLGGGDIKLLFALGLHTGFPESMVMLVCSCFTGLLYAVIMKKEKIPFGPCISIGMMIVMLSGNQLIAWYTKMIG